MSDNIRRLVNSVIAHKMRQENMTKALSARQMTNEDYARDMEYAEAAIVADVAEIAIGVLSDVNRIANALEIIAKGADNSLFKSLAERGASGSLSVSFPDKQD